MGVWGAYYGLMAPLALGVEDAMTDTGKQLLALGLSDALMLGASYAVSSKGFMNASDGAIPQLFGVGGAALGALGAFMATSNEQIVTISSMGSSLIGIGAGLVLVLNKTSWLPKHTIDTRGWSGMISPTLMPDGTTRIGIQINKLTLIKGTSNRTWLGSKHPRRLAITGPIRIEYNLSIAAIGPWGCIETGWTFDSQCWAKICGLCI